MDELEITLDSREVATMVNKEHKELLRDIRRYLDQMNEVNKEAFENGDGGERKIALSEFFIESSYISEQNKPLPCYQVTKKGCEFIAHKLTGIKGTEFTMRYINRFHEMEETLKENCVTNTADRLKNATLPEITNFLHETSSFLREMDRVMRDQNSHPSDIAEEFKNVCSQFGVVELSENFVKEPVITEPLHFMSLEEIFGRDREEEY